ncbi:hypothetical protein FQR65_LT16827 [Abscondita terminalis]|nr:hypothetical protein FQR65_LT16827 [Abscondita terminalis]
MILQDFATFAAARSKLRQAEDTSNLDSEPDEDEPRKRRHRLIVLPGEEEPEELNHSSAKHIKLGLNNKMPPYPSTACFNIDTSSPSSSRSISPTNNSIVADQKKRNIKQPISTKIRPNVYATTNYNCNSPGTFSENSAKTSDISMPSTSGSNLLLNDFSIASNSDGVLVERINIKLGYMQQAIDKLILSHQSLEKKIDQLISNSGGIESGAEDLGELELSLLGALPINNMEDFQSFDSKLSVSKSFRKKVVSFALQTYFCLEILLQTVQRQMLVSVSGKTPKLAAANFMKRIMTDSVAVQFSFKGRSERKRGFVYTNIYNIIESVIGSLFNTKCEIDLAKEAVECWLNQAKTRITRKSNRSTTKTAVGYSAVDESTGTGVIINELIL